MAFVLAMLAVFICEMVQGADMFSVGIAKVDISPEFPVRLTGYVARKIESTGVEQRLWAKAIAIGTDAEGPSILVTVDNCGVCAYVIDEVAARLKSKIGLPREKFAVCSSHTHSAPQTLGFAPSIFAMDLPKEQDEHIARYTKELTDKLESVALAALKDRRPGKLSWGKTSVSFAANRRTSGGPTYHVVPVLKITDENGKLRGVLANYACHCTTLGAEITKACGDWAGFAQETFESEHPGTIALIAVGCGADSNPSPRGGADAGLQYAKLHGADLASRVGELIQKELTPIQTLPICSTNRIQLPFSQHFTREQLVERAKQPGIVGFHANKYLKRLDAGEKIPTSLPYMVQSWRFGDGLAMVFLPGEVVVDYALRLNRELDESRLWINAYANDVPCYIPSKRVLSEGGYEAEDSLWYYDRPSRLAPECEDLIINAVQSLLPKTFQSDPAKSDFPPPKSPAEALQSFKLRPNFEIELVASEPQIVSPVAIDWDLAGRLWVVEMRDYPMGMDGKWKPGGSIRVLSDRDTNGHYQKATVFLENIPFPTGLMVWKKGVLVCAAPDIIYAEDTDGDGKADRVEKVFSGFYTDNYQARVNSLSLGLDNWIYGANGLLGGVIRGTMGNSEVNIRGRDFRFSRDLSQFEPVSGITQQGRVRNDWGDWFGCDNSTLLRQYPLPDHYIRRNPHVTYPDPSVFVPTGPDPNQLYPASRTMTRYNDPGSANRVTSACGLGIYRDGLLGTEFAGNAFICEPVHNLVRREVLRGNGVIFQSTAADTSIGTFSTGPDGFRVPYIRRGEFLASDDNWCRPVQVRTGPDGALWVVDMYRYLIEHPRWITADRLSQIDVRAGDDKGRIYRVFPKDQRPRIVPDLSTKSSVELVKAMDSPNGTLRDMIHAELLARQDGAARAPLIETMRTSAIPAAQVQALCVLDGMKSLDERLLADALKSSDAQVRRHAIRIWERFKSRSPELDSLVLGLAGDQNVLVRYQLILSLGEWNDPRASDVLAQLAPQIVVSGDAWFAAALLSAASYHAPAIAEKLAGVPRAAGMDEMMTELIATIVGSGNENAIARMMALVVPTGTRVANVLRRWQVVALAQLLRGLKDRKITIEEFSQRHSDAGWKLENVQDVVHSAGAMVSFAFTMSDQSGRFTMSADTLFAYLDLLGYEPAQQDVDLKVLRKVILRESSEPVLASAFAALNRMSVRQTPQLLIESWNQFSPSLRSRILSFLLDRNEWIPDVLTAIKDKKVLPAETPLVARQRLLKHSSPEIAKLASEVFGGSASSTRAQVIEQLKPALALAGRADQGAVVFGKTCATCHRFRNQGVDVGPDLAALRGKDADYLLKNIFDPNAVVEPRFVAYTVETKDGRSLNGIVSGETSAGFALVQPNGIREQVLRTQVKEVRASGLSLMPESLEQGLSHQDVADLISYLKTAPRPFGSASPVEAAASRTLFKNDKLTSVAQNVTSSERLSYPSWLGALPLALCRQTDGQSRLTWSATVPEGIGTTVKFQFPAAMGFRSQPSGKFRLAINSQRVMEFDVSLTDETWNSPNGDVQIAYDVREAGQEDSNGVLTFTVARALLKAEGPIVFEVTGSLAKSQRWFGIYVLDN